jgi:hypothetical protein
MSDLARRIDISEIVGLARRGGAFVENTSYARPPDAPFVPWGRKNFRDAASIRDALSSAPGQPAAEDATPATSADGDAPPPDTSSEAGEPPTETAAEPATVADPSPTPAAPEPAPAVPPPPPPAPSGPSPDEILEALEKSREEGRAAGYEQGLAAAREEFQQSLALVRALEADFLAAASASLQDNTTVMARHVRRLAQELAGFALAEMPEGFVARIRQSADMFTRAGTDFSLHINAEDAKTLAATLKGDELFGTIRVVEDDKLTPGGFRLVARDLELEDTPRFEDGPA